MQRLFNIRVPMPDGVTLSADVTLPDRLPAPAIVFRTPYNKAVPRAFEIADAYAAAGYAFVATDIRGRGDSDGVFVPYRNDGPDGVAVIDWAAGQDWCDGSVATWGGSYAGRIQWLTALERPAALRAMIVLVPPSDSFVEDPTGVPSPMLAYWHRMVDGRVTQHADAVEWESVYRHLPLATLDEAAGYHAPHWREELRHQVRDEWWDRVNYQHRLDEIDLPALHVSGWYDDEEIGTPLNFSLMSRHATAEQHLLMGPWGHQVNTGTKLGEVDFGPDAVIDLRGYEIGWLDRVLGRGSDRAPAAPVRIFVMGRNEWRDEQQWPPADTVETVLHLRSGGRAGSRFGDGALSPEPPGGDEPADSWTHDPARPVPFVTGLSSSQLGGPDDYSAVQTRGDVLCFTTPPVTEPLELVGPVRLVAHVATSARDTDVTAMLCDVHPNGFAQRLCDGLVRLRYRGGHREILDVEPGEVYEVEIAMWDTAHVVLPGHALRLQVASSAFPKFARNLGVAGDQTLATLDDAVVAENTLWHDAARPSRLVLRTRR